MAGESTAGEDARVAKRRAAAEQLVGKRVRFKGQFIIYTVTQATPEGNICLTHPNWVAPLTRGWTPSLFEVVEP